MGTVQYNEEYLSIKKICGVMTNKTRDDEGYTGLIRLVKVRGSSSSKSVGKCARRALRNHKMSPLSHH